jgi:signal transduction histidine kinase
LFSIRERMMLFGGEVSIATTEAGTQVSVRVPLPQRAEATSDAATGDAARFSGSLPASRDEAAR